MTRLKELRKKRNITQKELANRICVAQSTLSAWENEKAQMDYASMVRLADIFGVSVDYLIGKESETVRQRMKYIVLPTKNVEEIPPDGIISPSEIQRGEYACFTVTGDSMEPVMFEGDTVIVQLHGDYETGDIVYTEVNGKSRSVQQLTKNGENIILQCFNPAYKLQCYNENQLVNGTLSLAGKVVELRRKYK